jgi:hypothetical protein
MAHLPPDFLPASAGFSKTVFMTAGSGAAVLVQRRGKKFVERELKFADAHAALDWCLKHQANFSYLQGADPAQN